MTHTIEWPRQLKEPAALSEAFTSPSPRRPAISVMTARLSNAIGADWCAPLNPPAGQHVSLVAAGMSREP